MFSQNSNANLEAWERESEREIRNAESNSPATLLEVCSAKVAETMEKLSHLHKYRRPDALAISEAWLDDRAPDGRVVSGSSRAFKMDWELEQRQRVCCPIRDQWCKSAMALEMLHSHQMLSLLLRHSHLPQESLYITSFKLQADALFFFFSLLLPIQSLWQTVRAVICKWLDKTINDIPSVSVAVETT